MTANELQPIADAVMRRVQQQGFVLPDEVRALLAAANQPEPLWKQVISLVQPPLGYRAGRYYLAGESDRLRREQAIRKVVRRMVSQHRAAAHSDERREQARVPFVQLVTVRTEDGREYTLLSRDVSPTGIRLIGTRRLLGQKVRVFIPKPGSPTPIPACAGWTFLVRILWTCAVGPDLFENGGTFLELLPAEPEQQPGS